MAYLNEYAADHRAALSRARLAAQWRPRMRQWSIYRGQAWKIDRQLTEHWFLANIEILKGEGKWVPLSNAPPEIVLVDVCVAELVGCVVTRNDRNRDHSARDRLSWWSWQYDPDPDDEVYSDVDDDGLSEEDRRWEDKFNTARERAGDLLLIHYLLPHVRLYRKLRALDISERAYYYRLNSALEELAREYSFREEHLENVQS